MKPWVYLRSLATRLDTADMHEDAEKVRVLAQALEDAERKTRLVEALERAYRPFGKRVAKANGWSYDRITWNER